MGLLIPSKQARLRWKSLCENWYISSTTESIEDYKLFKVFLRKLKVVALFSPRAHIKKKIFFHHRVLNKIYPRTTFYRNVFFLGYEIWNLESYSLIIP